MKLQLYRFYSVLFVILLLNASNTSGQANYIPDNETSVTDNKICISQAIFLDPQIIARKESDTRIMDTLIRYLEYTPAGAQVYVCIYMFDYLPLVNALEKAYHRGVCVQMTVDSGRERSSKQVNKETITRFQTVLKPPSRILTVHSDTYPSAINHCKYVLFSEIDLPEGKAKDVVFSTSHNFTLIGTKKIQDAVVFTHKGLYETYKDNWFEIAARADTGMKNFSYKEVDFGDVCVYFFPRRVDGEWDNSDTYLEIFNNITDYAATSVRVVMSSWSRLAVAEKLTALHNKGVMVEVIAKDSATSIAVIKELVRLKEAGAYVKIINTEEKDTHSKITLINGVWGGRRQKLVFTGSHNYTEKALKYNNEVLLKINDNSLFNQYDNYFELLKNRF